MAQHDDILSVEKKYCTVAIKTAIFGALILILLSLAPIAKGLVLGTLFSILNFILMGATLPWKIGVSRKRATATALLSILMRYALLAAPLAIAVKFDQFNLAATVCGIFMIQILILLDHTLQLCIPSTRKKADS